MNIGQILLVKLNHTVATLVLIVLCLVYAEAQSDRIFVSAVGIDSGTCGSFTSPCRSFNVALPKTNSGGTITALDSGVYDSFNIVVSISATLTAAPGVHAELPGITVNTSSNDTVILRNLYISKRPGITSDDGIKITGVGAIHIETSVVTGFITGINFALGDSAQGFISRTIVRNNTGNGISFSTTAGIIKAAVDNCTIENNGHLGVTGDGLSVLKRARVTVRNSRASGNSGAGFVASAGDLNLVDCESSNNTDGVISSGTTTASANVIVAGSTVTNNSNNGFRQTGTGVFNSLGNNVVRRNGTNIFGTIGTISGS